ncbi:RNA polymerase subunit sigma-70 [Alcaligenaceae bacterium SJ-26]|nr:RNA polymerase subunit sigma-70 [Alcaligenaceae bacterium SJ-26]
MNDEDNIHEDLDTLAGEYVLGTLPSALRRQVTARLETDVALREAVVRWQARLLPLNDLVPPVEPSRALWERIATTLSFSAAPRSASAPAASCWQRLWLNLALWRGFAVACFACVVLLGGVLLQRTTAVEYVVVLVAPGSSSPGWIIQTVSADAVELIPLGSFRVPDGQVLEFWTKADDWSAPVSLGLVEPGHSLRVRLADLPPLEANQLFELTLEPASGSPTGKPTGPIQAIGRAVRL